MKITTDPSDPDFREALRKMGAPEWILDLLEKELEEEEHDSRLDVFEDFLNECE